MTPRPGDPGRLAEEMVEEDVGRARIVGAGIIADDGVEAEQGLDDRRLEIALEDVGGGLGEEIEQVALLLRGHAAHGIAELQGRQHVGEAAAGIGRGAQYPVAQDRDHRAERRAIGVIALGVLRRMAGDLAAGEAAPAREQIIGPGRGQEIVDLAKYDLQAVLVQPHVPDDLGVEQADRVGRGRVAKSRMEFLGDRGAADDVAPLEKRDLETLGGEVISADEAVMACADDEDVGVGGGGH
jgi:hypothetical protein